LSLDNDRLLDHIIYQYVMNIVMLDDSVPVNVLPAKYKCLVDDNLETKLDIKDVSIANLRKHIENLKGKNMVEKDVQSNNAKEIVEHARALRPLDSDFDSAYKYAKRFQEVTVYITAICPIYDLCVLGFVNDVNARSKSKYAKSSKKKNIWKPTSKVFTDIGYRWKPTGQNFTIDGNTRPLTRCSKHMTGNRSQLINIVYKFLGTVKFGNDQIAKIMGYGDYQIRNIIIYVVYYVEGLGDNLFFVVQFCDYDLEVAFRKHTSYIRDLEGVDLLKGSRGSNLYTLSLEDMMLSSPIYLLPKASKTKSWLWHRRLSKLNFDYITTLAKQGLVHGLPVLKFQKDYLCFACVLGKSKKHTHKPKEAIATAWYTQNRSLIRKHHNKTPYELLHNKKSYISYIHVFGAPCYPTNDSEDLGKLKPKADIRIFVGYAPANKAYRIYIKRTHIIINTIHVDFDKLTAMASEQLSLGPGPQLLTPGTIS
ncbi:integrase, catalytic region, zinc finger, CCHC-type containing protein, partial [Tanacetum coccineum]